jgi:hypothetical protein
MELLVRQAVPTHRETGGTVSGDNSMVHVLASIGFSFVALATLSFIVLMLAASREAIVLALGVGQAPKAHVPRHPVRIRTAGRWQATQTASVQPQRAVA